MERKFLSYDPKVHILFLDNARGIKPWMMINGMPVWGVDYLNHAVYMGRRVNPIPETGSTIRIEPETVPRTPLRTDAVSA